MAITMNTYPVQASNRSEYNVTTSLVEDATHVNLRIRATLYGPAGILAQIEQPKGSPAFDFTELLYKFINYKVPALVPSLTFAQQLIPKVGSNLITDWTNDSSLPLAGYADSGTNQLTFNHSAGGFGHCWSNNISVTAGKMYCLILKTGTIVGAGRIDQSGHGAGYYYPYYLSCASLPTLGRYIIFAVTTGTVKLYFGGFDPIAWTGVDVELYELAPCDWYVPYNPLWSEVYEDASGVTQVVTDDTFFDLNRLTGQMLFKAPGLTEAEFIAGFILLSDTKRFLNPYNYLNPNFAASQLIDKTPPSGQGSYNVWIGVLNKTIITVNGVAYYTNSVEAYIDSDTLTPAISYQPIVALAIGNTAFSTTRHNAFIRLKEGATTLSFDHHSILNLKSYPRLIELMWLNQYGGFTSLCLSDGVKETLIGERTDYEIPSDNYIKRRVAKAKKYWLVECESAVLDPRTPETIADLILSEYVLYSKVAGIFKEVFIRDKEVLLADNGNINKIRIAFEYAD